jgi:hypothetical protein
MPNPDLTLSLLEQLIRQQQEGRAELEQFWKRTGMLRALTLPALPIWLMLWLEMKYMEPLLFGLRDRYTSKRLKILDRFILTCYRYQMRWSRHMLWWERIRIRYLVIFSLVFSLYCYLMVFTLFYSALR